MKKWNRHHLVPRSRQGSDAMQNLLRLDRDIHANWHKVFGNRTLDEVIRLLTRIKRAKENQRWPR